MQDGNLIETVLMKFHYGFSVCVTTQVGCNIGCSFCASGLLRKNRDLDAGEIVGQIMKVQQHLDEKGQEERVSHIVVMGIGEPFDNYTNLMNFLVLSMHQQDLQSEHDISLFQQVDLFIKFKNLQTKISKSIWLFRCTLQTMNYGHEL